MTNAADVRAVIDRLLRDDSLFPIAMSAAEGAALRDVVVQERPTRTIEIGLAFGMSALCVCEGLVANGTRDARHTVIDPNQEAAFANRGMHALEDAGVLSMIEHWSGESQLVLPRLLEEGRTFDLAVVDGNHRFDRVFVDLFFLGRLLRGGSVIFLDDYQMPAIARATAFYVTNLGWTLEVVSAPDALHQWAILRTATEPDTRPFDYFVDF